MSWESDGLNTGNRVTFRQFRCTGCGRTAITCGTPPSTPCVCASKQRPKVRR